LIVGVVFGAVVIFAMKVLKLPPEVITCGTTSDEARATKHEPEVA
jgi:hypothetical protein